MLNKNKINIMKFTKGVLEFEVLKNTTNVSVIECFNNEIVKIEIPQYVEFNEVKYTITGIGNSAFLCCKKLKSINLPNTITYIDDYAFAHCENLQKIIIPNSVKEIGADAFEYCTSLESINLPNSVKEIGVDAFAHCTSLKNINLPNSVKFIGNSAFYHTNINFPKQYTKDNKLIAYKAFDIIDDNLFCRGFEYQEGETYTIEGKIQCCERGFHACTYPLDIFTYYYGEIDKHIEIHEVYLGGKIDEGEKEWDWSSKLCSSEITIGRKLNIEDINNLINQ